MAEKILVVDDEEDLEILIVQKFRKQIRNNEYQFVFAHNGLQALSKLIEHNDISIVLSDINMPEMDGLTLLARLNELKNPELKTVIVSAYGDMDNIRMAMNRGAFDFITKPVDFSDLEITINKTIEQLNLIRQAAADRDKLISLQKDLDVAGEIQQAILPKLYPPFPELPSIDIFGAMSPAKHVGGDFYDYFRIDEDRIGFVIGDVSGKGIPAAIFMAVSRTLIRATGLKGTNAAETINYANKLLCNESVDSMFVTIFYGVLNVRTGEINYCNAGHNCPIIIDNGGNIKTLPYTQNIVVGAFDDYEFKPDFLTLNQGDSLLLYTDGINEAFNSAQEEYGESRLQHYAQSNYQQSIKSFVSGLIEDVEHFAIGTEQSDDITVLTIKYM